MCRDVCSQALLDSGSHYNVRMLLALQALAKPNTLLVYHTTAWILRKEVGDRGMHKRTHLGRHGAVPSSHYIVPASANATLLGNCLLVTRTRSLDSLSEHWPWLRV